MEEEYKKFAAEKNNNDNNNDNNKNNYEGIITALQNELNTLKMSNLNPPSISLSQGEIDKIANQMALAKFNNWKNEYEEDIRNDSKNRQKGKLISSIDAQIMPLLGIGWFPGKFYEARFIGSPITYVVFKNLEDTSKDLQIEFVEITNKNISKAGRVRKAVADGNVKFTLINKSD